MPASRIIPRWWTPRRRWALILLALLPLLAAGEGARGSDAPAPSSACLRLATVRAAAEATDAVAAAGVPATLRAIGATSRDPSSWRARQGPIRGPPMG